MKEPAPFKSMRLRSVRSLFQYRARFLLLFGAALLLSGVSGVYFVRYLFKPNTGLVVNFPEVVVRDGQVVFAPKTPFSPAVASGLRPNQDVVLKVNGRPVRNSRDIVSEDARIWSFDAFPVEVLREEGVERLMVTPSLNPARVDWLFVLLFALALAFTAFYLIFNLPEDAASNFIALGALFYLVFTCLKPFYYESFFSNLMIHMGKMTSWFMVFFALYFPAVSRRQALRRFLVVGVLALYGLFITLRMVDYSLWTRTGEEIWLYRYRFLGRLGNVSDGVAFVLYAVLLASAYLRTPSIHKKRQVEWILAGFLIAIPPYFFLDQLPLLLGEAPGMRLSMGNFANLFLMFVPLFFSIGLIKHGAFNIKYFVNRYIVYFILVLILFAFFTIFYDPVLNVFVTSYGLPQRVAGFLVTSLLFISLVPLRSLLTRLLEQLFYKSYYQRSLHYSASLEKRNMELRMIIDELNRQNLRSFQSDKMRELRGIITGIAHRINNPANYISSGLEALERNLRALFARLQSGDTLSGAEFDRREEELLHLLHITQEGDLLIRDFIRKLVSLTGSRSGIPVGVEAGHLLKSAESEIRGRYPEIPLRLRVMGSARIVCHPGELIQAIRYAVENSIESLIDGDGEVVLKAMERDGILTLEIADRGMGIDELNLKKVFDPFFTTKAEHEGLGLYFCRTIVERNSGKVEIHSRPGEGTVVQFRFTLAPAQAPEAARAS